MRMLWNMTGVILHNMRVIYTTDQREHGLSLPPGSQQCKLRLPGVEKDPANILSLVFYPCFVVSPIFANHVRIKHDQVTQVVETI